MARSFPTSLRSRLGVVLMRAAIVIISINATGGGDFPLLWR